MATELKPCPFCGGEARFYHDHPAYENRMFIGCTECNAEVEPLDSVKHSKSDQVFLWNTRAAPDVPELVRYKPDSYDAPSISRMLKDEEGSYVRYDQAAAIISALKAELYDMQKERDRALEWRDHDRERAFTAEANNKRLREALETLVDRISYYASLAEEGTPNIEDWAYTDNSGDIAKARAALEGSKK